MKLEIERKLKEQLHKYPDVSPGGHRWDKVIEATLAEYRAGPEPAKAELLELRYIQGLPQEQVMEKLFVGKGTYWKWKREVFCTLGMKAAYAHLIQP